MADSSLNGGSLGPDEVVEALIPVLRGSFQASFKEDIVTVLQMRTLQKAQSQMESWCCAVAHPDA